MRPFLAAIAVCVLALPAQAQEKSKADHSKMLIDTATNLATANWKISSADWGDKNGPAWSVQLRTLHGGRQEGVQVIEVDNGAMMRRLQEGTPFPQ